MFEDPTSYGDPGCCRNLVPTGDTDGDGIDNASDHAPLTAAPRRP